MRVVKNVQNYTHVVIEWPSCILSDLENASEYAKNPWAAEPWFTNLVKRMIVVKILVTNINDPIIIYKWAKSKSNEMNDNKNKGINIATPITKCIVSIPMLLCKLVIMTW